ncbi:MAG: GNAT family N-acetyltransferase [Chitinivibrionales bacterium]
MHDMLVKLYDLDKYLGRQNGAMPEITIRKPIGPEKHVLVEWVGKKFFKAWASEFDMAMNNRPVTCFIAVQDKEPVGFACYDATARGFFGPTGVISSLRNRGIGTTLLLTALKDMRNNGYGYAIIGGVGPAEYYKKTVGAADIENSAPGIWESWIEEPNSRFAKFFLPKDS